MKEVYKEYLYHCQNDFWVIGSIKSFLDDFGALWCNSLVWDLCGVSKVILETNGIHLVDFQEMYEYLQGSNLLKLCQNKVLKVKDYVTV